MHVNCFTVSVINVFLFSGVLINNWMGNIFYPPFLILHHHNIFRRKERQIKKKRKRKGIRKSLPPGGSEAESLQLTPCLSWPWPRIHHDELCTSSLRLSDSFFNRFSRVNVRFVYDPSSTSAKITVRYSGTFGLGKFGQS